jgi:hypothetical protein
VSKRQSEQHFNRIIVVESTNDTVKSGKNLVEDVLEPFETKNPEVDFKQKYHSIVSRAEFETLLTQIAEDTERVGLRPILHLEMHGIEDASGMVFKNGDDMTWLEMTPALAAINAGSRNNLFVVLAVCFGAAMKEILEKHHERAPVFGLVGHTDEIFFKNFPRGFRAFYHEILSGGDGDRALDDLNIEGAEQKPDVEYRLRTAEGAFRDRMRAALKGHSVGKAKHKHVEEVLTKLREVHPDRSVGELRKRIKRLQKSGMRKPFNIMRDRYLMLDLFPEQRSRFTLEYDDVAAIRSK